DECDPATGQPTHVPLAPGALCSDGNSCNGIEACDGAGTCQAGTPLEVDDQNPCTVDTCDPETGVSHTPAPAGTACDDEDACNGAEFCDAQGECQAAPPLDPSDDNPCTVDTCDPELGVVNTPVAAGTSCDDGDVCNGTSERNEAGACIPGEPPVIDTTNPCLVGSCDPILGVTYAPADAGTSCDDGDVCNGVSTCNGAGSCEPGTPPAIDTSNPCQVGSCDPILGVI